MVEHINSNEANKLKFPVSGEEGRRAFIERSNELEGQYLDEEEREIMEAYNGGPDLPPPLTADEIDHLAKHEFRIQRDSDQT